MEVCLSLPLLFKCHEEKTYLFSLILTFFPWETLVWMNYLRVQVLSHAPTHPPEPGGIENQSYRPEQFPISRTACMRRP